ncbi:uncharacterized protein G2W53_021075 [Senna tora]|uniref:Uncharacterized protein n=1 Tax=Senna tora TaxID=362788 RepID=A0A834TKX2_9FABA|nr:uncharacterized protein G2W53_021075 [Senna tora]
MITMELKGITWVGNVYQKFENMCLDAEEMIYEDTVKYLENQAQNVGESVKKFYADVMQDFLPPSSCYLDERLVSEMPIDQNTDVEVHKKSFLAHKERPSKAYGKQTSIDLRANRDVDNDVTCAASYDKRDSAVLLTSASGNSVKVNKFDSCVRQRVRNTNIISNVARTKGLIKVTSAETEISPTPSCEVKNENHEADTASNISSAEVKMSDMGSGCCNEGDNASDEQINEGDNSIAKQIPDLPIFDNSAEEEMNMRASSSSVLSGEPNGFSIERVIQSDDYSYNRAPLYHSGGCNFNIDSLTEKGHGTMLQDIGPKLQQSCVMVSRDELPLVPKARSNLKTHKKKIRNVFTLGKKSGRKQEYEQLAVWHEKSEKDNEDCMENKKKALLSSFSESEWVVL